MRSLWARITGADKRRKYPEQQGVSLGRVGDYTVVFPYGMHCDLPDDTLLLEVAPGVAVPMNVERPDGSRGDVKLFHPPSNTRIVLGDGTVEITAEGASPSVTLNASGGTLEANVDTATINAATSVDVDSPATNLGSGGAPIARVGDSVLVGGVTGTITSGGSNTSI